MVGVRMAENKDVYPTVWQDFTNCVHALIRTITAIINETATARYAADHT